MGGSSTPASALVSMAMSIPIKDGCQENGMRAIESKAATWPFLVTVTVPLLVAFALMVPSSKLCIVGAISFASTRMHYFTLEMAVGEPLCCRRTANTAMHYAMGTPQVVASHCMVARRPLQLKNLAVGCARMAHLTVGS